jgi:tellurite resistance protein TerC
MTAVPVWAWVATFGVLAVLIAADLVLMSRIGDSLRTAAIESVLWLGAAFAFGGVLWLWRGPTAGSQYLAGYLL